MSAADNDWIILARDMISEFGRAEDVTFSRNILTGYDTNTLQANDGTPATYTLPAAPVGFSMREMNGTTVLTGMKKLYIPGGTSYAPIIGDTVDLGGNVYRVLEVIVYETESVDCAYLLKIGV